MGKALTDSVTFLKDIKSVDAEVSKTYEFQLLINFGDPFPSDNYLDVSATLNKLRVEGSFAEVQELFDLKRSLDTVRSIVNYFKAHDKKSYPILRSLCSNVTLYPYVSDSIDKILDRHGNIKDNASARLKEIRSELTSMNASVTRKLNSILKHAQAEGVVDPDANVSLRNGRGVIPVNVYDKRKIKGLIHDQSASGKTVFIEPAEIVELNNEIIELEYEERREIVKILTLFADNIRPYIGDLLVSNSFLGEIDFIRAKALLGIQLGSIKPSINAGSALHFKNAVHPLLFLAFQKNAGRKVVPLNISLDDRNRILLISGPNAGGKSVCLKTVGLLQYMLQCGFTIPAEEGSEAGIFNKIFIDIGDEQSIENDLSTYSSHLINMKYFLKNASADTMILIDEFGTGTEPMLGGSIAEAILGELNKLKVFGVITTHYTNLKHFASVTEGIINGAMAFDNHLMQPLFQLFIGKPGSSFAFEIAKKIGLPEDILNAASEKAGVKNIDYDRHLKDIARDKRYWENKRQNIRQHEKRLEELITEYDREMGEAKKLRKEIISKAKDEAKSILDNANKLIENTVREIREAQAEKEKTREIRQSVEEKKLEILKESTGKVTESERKVNDLKIKAVKFKPAKAEEEKQQEKTVDALIRKGDAVRMIETMAVGEVTEIRDGMVYVETGNFNFKVPYNKVEKVNRSELKKSHKRLNSDVMIGAEISQRKLRFSPEIDIRGVRGDEAIERVRQLLDDAVIVQHRNLRILHGKGNGILRELVRKYLATAGFVKSFRDESVEFGGSGITVVELDL
jgi:DNA mismatch repair protein MutS2